MKVIQVSTTTDSLQSAERIARKLLEDRLAACIQVVGPIHSHYRWEGRTEKSAEYLLLIKSREEIYPDLEQAIRELHHYDVPEIISVPVTRGSSDYFSWLESCLIDGK
jgi:periplasmic divalent cation tolerance protein